MTRAEVLALAARCEAGEPGLDGEIALAVGVKLLPSGHWLSPGRIIATHFPPSYTSSLDAAASLYPVMPEKIPSDARKATAEALRAIAAGTEEGA